MGMRFGHVIVIALLTFTGGAIAKPLDHGVWNALLQNHVLVLREGRATQVDYQALAQKREALSSYLTQLESVSRQQFDSWPKPEQLAFLINAYNAWTVELILRNYPGVESIRDLGSWLSSPWKQEFIPLLGATRSLDEIEHEMIRGSGGYNEPRIHFAVNCASIGCPALLPEAFTGPALEQQLDRATRLFLADATRDRLRDDEVQISKIFKWYREDFERPWRGATSLESFLGLYSAELQLSETALNRLLAGDLEIEFLEYDWGLNDKM